jgi:hypothetical protein
VVNWIRRKITAHPESRGSMDGAFFSVSKLGRGKGVNNLEGRKWGLGPGRWFLLSQFQPAAVPSEACICAMVSSRCVHRWHCPQVHDN